MARVFEQRRTWGACVGVALASCGHGPAPSPRPAPASSGEAIVADLLVTASPGAETLDVQAKVRAGSEGFELPDAIVPFVDGMSLAVGESTFAPIPRRGLAWSAPPCKERDCLFRYRVRLAEAARQLHDVDLAASFDGAFVAPPSSWILRRTDDDRGRYRFRLTTPADTVFASSVFADTSSPGAFSAPVASLDDAAFAALGRWHVDALDPGTKLTVARAPGAFAMSEAESRRWVGEEAQAVGEYLGGFPVPSLLVMVLPQRRDAIDGVTQAGGGAAVLLRVGHDFDLARAHGDWVLTHELLHVTFPTIGRPHRWMEEGLSTYVEPIVRARSGAVPPQRFWSELFEGVPQGQPAPGERGLVFSHSWASTYWGGALFWFVADVQIRERTKNERSLDDVLRAIVRAGGGVHERWPVERVLATGDAATGVPVLTELYASMGRARGEVDLPSLFARLGVRRIASGVTFDDGAPLAAARKAITTRSPR